MFLRSLFREKQINYSFYSVVYANQDNDAIKATFVELNSDSPIDKPCLVNFSFWNEF